MSDNLATKIIHWPGKPTAVCDKHAIDLQGLNNFMGGPLLAETALPGKALCINCVNESKKEEE